MSSERLSKLQKYILTACYQKTILKQELPKKIDLFESALSGLENGYVEKRKKLYYKALYESDILLNHFNLSNYNNESYGYVGGSNKEKTILRRSLKLMHERGYIEDYNTWSIDEGDSTGTYDFCGKTITTYEASYQSRAIIRLTAKGISKAEELLKVVEAPPMDKIQQ